MAVERHGPGTHLHEAEDRLEKRRLAGTVRADDPDELALLGVKGHAIEDVHSGEVPSLHVNCVEEWDGMRRNLGVRGLLAVRLAGYRCLAHDSSLLVRDTGVSVSDSPESVRATS